MTLDLDRLSGSCRSLGVPNNLRAPDGADMTGSLDQLRKAVAGPYGVHAMDS